VIGGKGWDPRWSVLPPLIVTLPVASDEQRRALWGEMIGDAMALTPERWTGLAAYRLAPEQVLGAAIVARQRAASLSRTVEVEDLQAGARAQNSAGLNRLARRIEPRARFDDLVVPDQVEQQLRGVAARARLRQRVLDDWHMASTSSEGRGVTALFAGDSGTGKTMSAEVVAGNLGLDLYVIDLSTVVDKYIGETEKNLDRIFDQAERVNGVLLFDEADAIFGKRSEVKDARDRYANVEVAYLLQRMEQFEGIAILTTNLRANIDEAFLRRLDVLIDFPVPDPASRRRLWAQQLRPELPVSRDIDVDFLANGFKLSGGNIRNIVLASAFDAAEDGDVVSMAHVIRATAAEYRKLGRLCVEAEFGAYFSLINQA
jgi:SpoVK/Ycf46/Vps4 family AAA+-type ATPase